MKFKNYFNCKKRGEEYIIDFIFVCILQKLQFNKKKTINKKKNECNFNLDMSVNMSLGPWQQKRSTEFKDNFLRIFLLCVLWNEIIIKNIY